MSDILKFRAMVQWLRHTVKWEVDIANGSKKRGINHFVCLFGTGGIAWEHYNNRHLAEKYDKQLHLLMTKVGSAQDSLDKAREELHNYIESRNNIETRSG